MASRLKLQEELCSLLGSRNVYFQPPESFKMKYPCIRYTKSDIDAKNADDRKYKVTNKFELVVIDPDPDSALPELILEHFQMCSFGRAYQADNLNHTILYLYY